MDLRFVRPTTCSPSDVHFDSFQAPRVRTHLIQNKLVNKIKLVNKMFFARNWMDQDTLCTEISILEMSDEEHG